MYSLNKYDNSSIWAMLLIFNSYLYYLAPVKIYIDNNTDINNLKIIIFLIFL